MAEEKINVNGTVITFFSTASAVGKTLVSCNVAAELARLGAHIRVENRVAVVEGTPFLTGARVTATDLRAGAALILAGLCAEGETTVCDEGGHIARGYAGIEEKLRAVGGRVERVEEP